MNTSDPHDPENKKKRQWMDHTYNMVITVSLVKLGVTVAAFIKSMNKKCINAQLKQSYATMKTHI